jgi:PAS domain S-box-containing protein
MSADPAVRKLQIDEVFRFAGLAAGFSYFGALLTLGVLIDTGDIGRGSVWFLGATGVTLLRVIIVIGYRRRDPTGDPNAWGQLLIAANVLAGIQWGLLGTVLFPVGHGYRELFTIMVITCFVGGSLAAYAALPWCHQALSLPATIPTAIYLFFIQDGLHVYAGVTGLFFCFAIVYYALKLTRHFEDRFRLQVAYEDLLKVTGGVAEQLALENRELQHRAAVRGASMESAREQAERLFAHFLRSPLPMLECDAHAKVVSCNPAAERLLGERESEMQGRPLAEHIASTGRNKFDTGLDAYFPSGDSSTQEVEILAHGVRVARCVASFTRLPAPEGLHPGFGVVFAAPPR